MKNTAVRSKTVALKVISQRKGLYQTQWILRKKKISCNRCRKEINITISENMLQILKCRVGKNILGIHITAKDGGIFRTCNFFEKLCRTMISHAHEIIPPPKKNTCSKCTCTTVEKKFLIQNFTGGAFVQFYL